MPKKCLCTLQGELLKSKRTNFLQAGRGRSVVATVCYLTEEFSLSTEEAVDLVKKERPQINMGFAQIQACRDYEHKYVRPRKDCQEAEQASELSTNCVEDAKSTGGDGSASATPAVVPLQQALGTEETNNSTATN